MSKSILQDIIEEFDSQKFVRFFREKNRNFSARQENLAQYNDENFKDGLKLGEIRFADREQMIISIFKVTQSLSERSDKRAQYEKGKKILKDEQHDAGIFIFYDEDDSFRFSLIYANYLGKKRDWSTFRRFTYFVSKELTNKTFLQIIGDGDFSSLEKIKDAFSVEKVTKEFYKDIANWYFWAIQHCKFPKDAEAEENGRNVAIIRLITRLIFIWFMHERGLVPDNLFKRNEINNYLKNFSSEETTYYRAILQNLFFATLSTKQKERTYASEQRFNKGWNKDYDNQYVFRYHELFKKPDDLKKYFCDIPFLNGGLFECLDDKRRGIIIDGFSRTKKNQPIVPNFLFFSDEKDADLNAEFGTKKKKYKVRGLINTLSSYNFTIDENDPNDAEVALDPELLGKVFENLLASFNPETASTARKATGSYYTPREIVDYMVTQSLKEYFRIHLKDIKRLDGKLDQLFENEEAENPFASSISEKIVKLIDNLRIVDPAVGSGAFPMGILNKLVFILAKLDPENKIWKEAQTEAVQNNVTDLALRRRLIEQINEQFKNKNFDYGRKLYLIQKCIYGVDIQQIAVEIAKLRFFIALLVDENIDKDKENWGIEPLPNLDFKIMQGNSLIEELEGIKIFDEKFIAKVDYSKEEHAKSLKQKQLILQREYFQLHSENNLTRLKQAELNNKLQEVNKQLKNFNRKEEDSSKKASLFDIFSEAKKRVEEFKKLQKEFFTPDLQNKKDIKEKLNKLEWELIEATLKEQGTTSALKKLEKYKKSNTKPFFLWKLYFTEVFQGDNPGFDIVIANPPYVNVEKIDDIIKKSIHHFKTAYQKYDLYVLFYEKSISLLKNNGVLTFISSNKFLSQGYGFLLRKHLLNFEIDTIINFNFNVFESAVVRTCIFQLTKKEPRNNKIKIIDVNNINDKYKFLEQEYNYINQEVFEKTEENNFRINLTKDKIKLLDKVKNGCLRVDDICSVNYGLRPVPKEGGKDKEKFIKQDNPAGKYKIYFEGKDMGKWSIKSSSFLDYKPKEMYNPMFKELFQNPKIFGLCTLSDIGKLRFNYDDTGMYCNHSVVILTLWYLFKDVNYSAIQKNITEEKINTSKKYSIKYLQVILNSKLIKFYVNELLYDGTHFYPDHMKSLPIKISEEKEQRPVIKLVDKILAITKDDDYLQNEAKQKKVKEYEDQIDKMVYKLYGLTKEEIKIIENDIHTEIKKVL